MAKRVTKRVTKLTMRIAYRKGPALQATDEEFFPRIQSRFFFGPGPSHATTESQTIRELEETGINDSPGRPTASIAPPVSQTARLEIGNHAGAPTSSSQLPANAPPTAPEVSPEVAAAAIHSRL